MIELTSDLNGETEHQFDYLLNTVRIQEGEDLHEAVLEELAERLLSESIREQYIQAVQNGQ